MALRFLDDPPTEEHRVGLIRAERILLAVAAQYDPYNSGGGLGAELRRASSFINADLKRLDRRSER